MSVLFCKNIDHWGQDDQWHVYFPNNEEVVVSRAFVYFLREYVSIQAVSLSWSALESFL
jgi:hypothetical protein